MNDHRGAALGFTRGGDEQVSLTDDGGKTWHSLSTELATYNALTRQGKPFVAHESVLGSVWVDSEHLAVGGVAGTVVLLRVGRGTKTEEVWRKQGRGAMQAMASDREGDGVWVLAESRPWAVTQQATRPSSAPVSFQYLLHYRAKDGGTTWIDVPDDLEALTADKGAALLWNQDTIALYRRAEDKLRHVGTITLVGFTEVGSNPRDRYRGNRDVIKAAIIDEAGRVVVLSQRGKVILCDFEQHKSTVISPVVDNSALPGLDADAANVDPTQLGVTAEQMKELTALATAATPAIRERVFAEWRKVQREVTAKSLPQQTDWFIKEYRRAMAATASSAATLPVPK